MSTSKLISFLNESVNCIEQWNLYMTLFSLLLNTYRVTENYKWKQGLWGLFKPW